MTEEIDSLGKGPYRSDGRLIISYPKSGRTWIRFALLQAGIDARFSHAAASSNRREIGLPFRGIPPSLEGVPLVFLHRHPIDTAVSMFYQTTRRNFYPGRMRWFRQWLPLALRGALPPRDIDAFVLSPYYGMPKLCAFNRAWLDYLAGREDCLILTYEAMRADAPAGFQRLLDFWKINSTNGAALAEASDFAKMRAAELARTGKSADDSQSLKTRKAKVGGYIDELRPETIARCREIAAGFGFPIEPPAGSSRGGH